MLRQHPTLVRAWFHEAAVRDAAFSPGGQRAVTASEDWTACLWDTASGEPLTGPLRHQGPVVGPVGRAEPGR